MHLLYPPFFALIFQGTRPRFTSEIRFKSGTVHAKIEKNNNHLAPVVQRVDSAIRWTNYYPLDNAINFDSTYPLDSDLSKG